ncbi:MAG: hypothetical protein AAF687_00210 [Pseudomonadota bacterium]
MPARFELTTRLEQSPDEIWAQVMKPALFLHVAAPLVRFKPIGMDDFPDRWAEGEYRGDMRLFGLIPIGWQAIVIELPDAQGDTYVLYDKGYSPVLRTWSHRISVKPEGGGTRYSDAIAFDAGWLTGFSVPFLRLFFKHRQRRLRSLAAEGFASMKG